MNNYRLKDNQKLGYICLDCGLEIFDDNWNPYTCQPVGIKNEAIKMSAILHCIETGHQKLLLRDTDIIITVKT